MNTKPKFLLSIALIFSAIITTSTFAQNAKPSVEENSIATSELNKPFVCAVEENDLKEMQQLIEAGADVNALISYTYTSGDCDWETASSPLIFAIKYNLPEIVRVLLQAKNKLNITLNQALDEAIREGRCAIVEELIKEGADVNAISNEEQNSPLILATKNARPISQFNRQAQEQSRSRWEARKKIIEILLKAGADISHVNKYGRTALIEAIENYDLNTVQNLLKIPKMTEGSFFFGLFGKKPINHVDEDGNTALIIAVKKIKTSYIAGNSQEYNICLNSQSIVEELLKTPGIDPHHVNKKGETAISLLEKIKEYL